MEKTVNIDDFKKELEKRKKKEKLNQRINSVKNWAANNPELATLTATTLLGVGAATVKSGLRITNSIIRTSATRKESKAKELKIYDRSMMKYWNLRRPLTNDELKEIERRKKNEKLSDILESMKVLK